MTHEVECLRGCGEDERRDLDLVNEINSKTYVAIDITYRKDNGIEQDRGNVERRPPTTKIEVGVLEVVGSHCKTKQRDQAVGGRGWDTAGGNQRSESHLAGKDGTQQHCTEGEHDGDSVAWLLLVVNLPDPTRQRQYAVASNREDEARSGDNSHTGAL